VEGPEREPWETSAEGRWEYPLARCLAQGSDEEYPWAVASRELQVAASPHTMEQVKVELEEILASSCPPPVPPWFHCWRPFYPFYPK
jgi:hypothetical protein